MLLPAPRKGDAVLDEAQKLGDVRVPCQEGCVRWGDRQRLNPGRRPLHARPCEGCHLNRLPVILIADLQTPRGVGMTYSDGGCDRLTILTAGVRAVRGKGEDEGEAEQKPGLAPAIGNTGACELH